MCFLIYDAQEGRVSNPEVGERGLIAVKSRMTSCVGSSDRLQPWEDIPQPVTTLYSLGGEFFLPPRPSFQENPLWCKFISGFSFGPLIYLF